MAVWETFDWRQALDWELLYAVGLRVVGGGELDSPPNCLRLGKFGVQVPLDARVVGHFVLSEGCATDGRRGHPHEESRARMANGRTLFPHLEDGLCKFLALEHVEVWEAVALKDAKGSGLTDARNIAQKLHLNWGPASAH